MPKTNDDLLGPRFRWQLRSALDRIQPAHSTPRYVTATPRQRSLRLAPLALAASVTGVLLLSVTAITGSANPKDWPARIATAVQPVIEPTPTPGPSPTQTSKAPAAAARPSHSSEQPPSQKPELNETGPTGAPGRSAASPSPSPEPGEEHGPSPTPSPGSDH